MVRAEGDAVLLAVRVKPRSARAALQGERAGRLLVQVTAPPLDGRANEAVCRLIARTMGVAAGRVSVAVGQRGRDKVVRIERIAVEEVTERLARASADANARPGARGDTR